MSNYFHVCDSLSSPTETTSFCLLFRSRSGISNENIVPPPGPFSAQMRPLCAAMISWQIANPNPVPPAPDLVLLDCTNLSKTASSSLSGTPGPWSRTETTAELLLHCTEMPMLPPLGENLTALLSRLRRTCFSFCKTKSSKFQSRTGHGDTYYGWWL